MPSTTTPIGTSRIASISESMPIRNKSDLQLSSFGAIISQKRARTSDDSTRSEHLFCPVMSVVAMRSQRTSSRSPSRFSAWPTDATGDDNPSKGEFR